MQVRAEILRVRSQRTFTIARSSSDEFELVVLEIEDSGRVGRGEAAPTGYYGQNAREVRKALESVEIPDHRDIEGTLAANPDLPSSALSALDAALHDLNARELGVPVYRMLGLSRPAPQSAFTLGIDEPETTVAEAERLSNFPVLKMKIGGWRDVETVRAVSRVSSARLWVDANEAFSPDEAVEVVRELKEIGVEMIEQPVAASEGPKAMRRAMESASPTPVISDESSLVASDVPPLAGCVSGVNVKLAKSGGIRGALEMIHTARAHKMMVMLGCMVESSLGIAAAAQISSLVDFVDLDGAMLLAEDPFSGLEFRDGGIEVPETPGLGVEPR